MTAPAPRASPTVRRWPSVFDAHLRTHGRDPEAVHRALCRRALCRQLQLPGTVLASIRRGCKKPAAPRPLESC